MMMITAARHPINQPANTGSSRAVEHSPDIFTATNCANLPIRGHIKHSKSAIHHTAVRDRNVIKEMNKVNMGSSHKQRFIFPEKQHLQCLASLSQMSQYYLGSLRQLWLFHGHHYCPDCSPGFGRKCQVELLHTHTCFIQAGDCGWIF